MASDLLIEEETEDKAKSSGLLPVPLMPEGYFSHHLGVFHRKIGN